MASIIRELKWWTARSCKKVMLKKKRYQMCQVSKEKQLGGVRVKVCFRNDKVIEQKMRGAEISIGEKTGGD